MDRLSMVKAGFAKLKFENKIKDKAFKNLEEWMTDENLTGYRPYIDHLIDSGNWSLLLDSFWRMIPFGTGGRRGPVGAGPNRINPHTISLSVQGHCEYLKDMLDETGDMSVVVAHDVRQFFDMRGLYSDDDGEPIDGVLKNLTSLDMAKISAMTYAANGITAYVVGALEQEGKTPVCTNRYMSTPELSFLIRELDASGGLNISASHNHPDDNGGKFYNSQGGQEIPPNDEALLKKVEQVKEVKTIPYAEARDAGRIKIVPANLHLRYINVNLDLSPSSSRSAKVAYTPLCGTGMTTVFEALEKLGYDVETVPDQSIYDGSFKSVRYRIGNPEVADSMDRLQQVAVETGCDVGFSTDPDADRLGMIAPGRDGKFQFINGNELGVILTESIINARRKTGKLSKKAIFINTLVTSSLQRKIARQYGLQVIGDLMVGFKYMGDVMGHLERSGRFPPKDDSGDTDSVVGDISKFLFTTEESHGYLLTSRIRDKDACGAAVHLAGLASDLKDAGKTFEDYLRDIYRVYGYHRNVLRSLVMEGITGLQRIQKIQEVLRANPPEEIAGLKVLRFVDNHVVGGPLKSSTDKASRNVLLFELDGGKDKIIRLVVRPSGTEPKTKLYVEVPSRLQLAGTLEENDKTALSKIDDDTLDGVIKETDKLATQIGDSFIRFCLGSEVLGDVYPLIPPESLLVSDLVPVDHKIRLCTGILPELAERLTKKSTNDDIVKWLNKELVPFGEDAIGLVKNAAINWIDNCEAEKTITASIATSAKSFF